VVASAGQDASAAATATAGGDASAAAPAAAQPAPPAPAPASCSGEWKFPVTCDAEGRDCLYHAAWEYVHRLDSIRFTLRSNLTNRWLGIAFSTTTGMVRQTCHRVSLGGLD